MTYQKVSINRLIQFFSLVAGTLFLTTTKTHAQGMMEGNMSCPMCGAMGWGGVILGGLLSISVIAALVALTLFLIRRSRSERPSH